MSGSPYVYYTATQQGGAAELERFVEAVEGSAVPRAADVRAGLRPQSWEAAVGELLRASDSPSSTGAST